MRCVMSRPIVVRAARRDGEGDVAGAGRQIERALARSHVRERDQLRLPSRVLPVRQQRRDQIVTIGDRRRRASRT